ncbi:DUF1349 domain-containing protein [Erwinia sorbitola]|uniref:DUF1349 domain-containing protein n=1 Tax=Erwinia sorbitola TaxID=2681984 RepID=A0ABW9RFH4_9GAMM|nr:DUF1349 domain-containing protein [Erwinia sorbitola]MTD27656.1 DUF1349 domain-containing protein [Erwinia sorbitola]
MVAIASLGAGGGVWINQPEVYSLDGGKLRFITEHNTDFWAETYYGFQRHTGHAYGFYVEGDFTLQVKVMADFSHLYDQAGIFILDDERHWLKAGIEFNDDVPSIGCVATRVTSDWSTGLFPGDPAMFWMRATLEHKALRIQYSTDGLTWPLLRLLQWPEDKRRFVGVMGCTPERQGLEATFEDFIIAYPQGKSLHDLT